MSYTIDQWRTAITNLLKMTSINELKWSLTDIEVGDAWTTVDRSLKSEMGKNAYVVSQIRTKYYHDEDAFSWDRGYTFSIYEKVDYGDYEKVATAPTMSAVASLFEAAENNLAFNRNALGGLLG